MAQLQKINGCEGEPLLFQELKKTIRKAKEGDPNKPRSGSFFPSFGFTTVGNEIDRELDL